MKQSFSHCLILLFFSMACLCLGEGKTRGQKKTHVVKHKNKRWRIKTADGGKGKDYQEEDANGYSFLALQDAGALVVIEV